MNIQKNHVFRGILVDHIHGVFKTLAESVGPIPRTVEELLAPAKFSVQQFLFCRISVDPNKYSFLSL